MTISTFSVMGQSEMGQLASINSDIVSRIYAQPDDEELVNTSDGRTITRRQLEIEINAERSKMFPYNGKIAPFGYTILQLAEAVALKAKPIAEHTYETYLKNKELFDKIISDYGLDKIEDLANDALWLFRHENREGALRRIEEYNAIHRDIRKRGYFTFDDHRKLGELFGYSDDDINKYINWRTLDILRSYTINEKGIKKQAYISPQTLLVDMSCGIHKEPQGK